MLKAPLIVSGCLLYNPQQLRMLGSQRTDIQEYHGIPGLMLAISSISLALSQLYQSDVAESLCSEPCFRSSFPTPPSSPEMNRLKCQTGFLVGGYI